MYQASKEPGAYADYESAPPTVTLGFEEWYALQSKVPATASFPPKFETFAKESPAAFCEASGCQNVSYFVCCEDEMACDEKLEFCQKHYCPQHIKLDMQANIMKGGGIQYAKHIVSCKDCNTRVAEFRQSA